MHQWHMKVPGPGIEPLERQSQILTHSVIAEILFPLSFDDIILFHILQFLPRLTQLTI